jgi:AcrR family transcriptional regulator
MESNSSYRTRRDLQVALMTLVKRQSFETVTIRDITDQAHVNHSTFYRYYHSKYDLLRDVLPVMLDGAFATSGTSDEDIIVSGLTWTNAHRSLVRNLFNEVDAMQTYTELLQVLTSVVNTNRLQQVQPGSPLLAHLQTLNFPQLANETIATILLQLIRQWATHSELTDQDLPAFIEDAKWFLLR